jgi:uncharacterized OsmC-like protein
METHRAAAMTDTIINGVDVNRLLSTIDAIKAVPGLARFTFRASNRWMGGGVNRTTIRGFRGAGAENERDIFVIDNAEPFLMLGSDEAPNPLEYVLHALVGCLTTTFVYHATLRGVRILEIESQIEGHLDLQGFLGLREDLPSGFGNVRATYRVKADCSAETLNELMGIACRRSPVLDIFTGVVPMSVTCEPV